MKSKRPSKWNERIAYSANIPDPKTGERLNKLYVVCLACAYHSLVINADYPEHQGIKEIVTTDDRCDKCGVWLQKSFGKRRRQVFLDLNEKNNEVA